MLGPKAIAFLKAYRQSGRIDIASEAAGISRNTHNRMLQASPEYNDKFALAQAEVGSIFEDEVTRRGVEGTIKAVWFKGEVCGHEREYSDACLLTLLKGALPQKYNTNRMEHTVTTPKGGPIAIDTYGLANLDESELKVLLRIARKLSRSNEPVPDHPPASPRD